MEFEMRVFDGHHLDVVILVDNPRSDVMTEETPERLERSDLHR